MMTFDEMLLMRDRYGGNLMLNHEYIPFQYVVVYIAVLQGGMGAGQWLSYGPSKFQDNIASVCPVS